MEVGMIMMVVTFYTAWIAFPLLPVVFFRALKKTLKQEECKNEIIALVLIFCVIGCSVYAILLK